MIKIIFPAVLTVLGPLYFAQSEKIETALTRQIPYIVHKNGVHSWKQAF